jgi:hypothetical protein
MFSSVVGLTSAAVTKTQPSVDAACQSVTHTLPVSLTALCSKLSGTEPGVVSAPVIVATKGRMPPGLAGMPLIVERLAPVQRGRFPSKIHNFHW